MHRLADSWGRTSETHVSSSLISRADRGKTVTESLALSWLGLLLSERQIPQVVEILESGVEPKEALEMAVLRPRQVRYQAALGPDSSRPS